MFSIGVTSYSPIVWHRPKGSSRIVWKCAAQNNSLQRTIPYKLADLCNLEIRDLKCRAEILELYCRVISRPTQRIRHFCIGDSLPPREQTWLLIKMELPCSPSSRLFNNTSTYYCSQTQISQLLNNSKCFPGQEEYSNREELISHKKCEYGKHLGRMSLPSSKLSNPVLWRSGNPLKCAQRDISYFLSYLWL